MTRTRTIVIALAAGVAAATAAIVVAVTDGDRHHDTVEADAQQRGTVEADAPQPTVEADSEQQQPTVEADVQQRFGVGQPLEGPSADQVDAATAEADPTALVSLASGLTAHVVTSAASAGAKIDMMTLWPNDEEPTHLIVCNEQGTTEPGVQRIDLATGDVETILTGTRSCDPAHRTPWGTVIVAEEHQDGRLLEIIDPLHTTGVSYRRSTRAITDTVGADESGNVVVRDAVGQLAFEGVGILHNGVLYYGDENRPASGRPGGAYFKFVPDDPWTAGDPAIGDLADSPLASGRVYGLRLGGARGNADFGQGSETGEGVWVPVAPGSLRDIAAAEQLTGYYRPEDLDIDRAAEADGHVRFCANNTGNEGAANWGNTICLTDGTVEAATAVTAVPRVELLVAGDPELAMMDNIAYQPGRGNWIIHEDGAMLTGNNDLWSCLDDGADRDVSSDGCVRIGTLVDANAEWTGGFFDGDGSHFYVSIQHNVTGHGVVLAITGWE